MGKKCSTAIYLFLDRSGYYFRVCIPLDPIASFGQKEFRHTLKTRLLPEARYKARRMAGFVQSIFREIRKGGTMKQFAEAELKRLVENQFREVLNDVEERFLNTPRSHNDSLSQGSPEIISEIVESTHSENRMQLLAMGERPQRTP